MLGLSKPLYKRILLKLSGEIFSENLLKNNFEEDVATNVALSIKQVHDLNVDIGIVIGAGNIFRGGKSFSKISRVRADHIGMIATIINGLYLQELLEKNGCQVSIFSSFPCGPMVEVFSFERVNRAFQEGKIVIFAGGTGCSYFTTDTTSAIKALEIGADILIKATKVDGVYDKDPLKEANSTRYSTISYSEVLKKDLKVMDATAITLCRENKLPIYVFDIFNKKILKEVIFGKQVGTIISGD
jgi:uridylate kinase